MGHTHNDRIMISMESREQINDAIPSLVAEALVHDIAKPRAVGDGYHIGPGRCGPGSRVNPSQDTSAAI